jgi:F-type H+-transporting ATPase subunit delta
MTEQRVSNRYASALLDTAEQEGITDQVYNDFLLIKSTFRLSHELRAMTASPIFQQWRKKKIYEELFTGRVSQLVLKFLILLLDKRRGELIPSIIIQFQNQYNILKNRLQVEISSAIELNDEIKGKIIEKLTIMTQKTILPEFNVNPSLKGGVLVRIEDWVYDATIKNQLDILLKSLSEGEVV